MLEENLQDLSKLGMQARIVPNYEGGRYAGFRLVGVRPDSIYKAIGLQSGDLIRRVNGSDIDTPNKAIELFEQLRNSPSISLDIERRGQKVTQMYQIK
jgi:general secretion pathway protein C